LSVFIPQGAECDTKRTEAAREGSNPFQPVSAVGKLSEARVAKGLKRSSCLSHVGSPDFFFCL